MHLPRETPISLKIILLWLFKFQLNYLLVCLYNGYSLINGVFLPHSFPLFFLLFLGGVYQSWKMLINPLHNRVPGVHHHHVKVGL